MTIDDKEFILNLLDDYETYVMAHLVKSDLYTRTALARTILDRSAYVQREHKETNPRSTELDFNEDYRDWHHGVDLDEGES